jgi:hypothetical protein
MVLFLARADRERICSPSQYPDLHLLEYFHSTSESRAIFKELHLEVIDSILDLVKILVHAILKVLLYLRCFGLEVL